ncbi:MAG TPA: hypothetical protein VFB37_01750, partial [Steroidobacteraceae bacterium]|nr:hypothetical protein [Steroidobacteraceae bacterium]
MSFILDALKKSESDRQRQTGPALFEVKIAPPKSRFPLWAVSIAVLLAVNAAVGGWLLLRHSSSSPAQAPAAVPALAQSPAPVTSGAAPSAALTTEAITTAPAGSGPPAAAPAQPSPATLAQPTRTYSAGAGTGRTDAVGAATSPAPIGAGGSGEPTLATNGKPSELPQGSSQEAPTANPDDYAPAAEPKAGPGLGSHVKVGTSSGYILYQDAAVVPGAT